MSQGGDSIAVGRSRRSIIGRWISDVSAGARGGWRQLPRGALRRWLLALAGGAVLSFALTAGLTLFASQYIPAAGWGEWDRQVISGVDDWPVSFTNAIILESPGNILVLLPLTLYAAALYLRRGRVLWAGSLLVCYAVARLLIWTGWALWERPRPDLVAGGVGAMAAHSFPSGHILLVFTTYGLLAWSLIRSTRAWLDRLAAVGVLMAIAAIVTLARLRLGAHWPTDMAAGAVIGLFWLGWNIAALEWAERVWPTSESGAGGAPPKPFPRR
jgi:undecaprenyl-diphosphatase